MTTRTFQSTSEMGIDHDMLPMRLWHKAKKLGTWDPRDIDFEQDRKDWLGLNELEHEVLLHLSAEFLGGEESVALDLLPLIGAIAKTGRLEEEMYLTSFLYEEAKHVEVFRRFFDEVCQDHSDLSRYHGPNYVQIFHDELPRAMNRLNTDTSPVAIATASVTYNMIVEGTLAETGYHAYNKALVANDIMPGMQEVTRYLNMDESRHIAFGVYLLSRLTAEFGDEVWEAIEAQMNHMLPLALGMIDETLSQYETLPFGITLDEFIGYATTQFQKRYARIEKARGQTVSEVMGTAA